MSEKKLNQELTAENLKWIRIFDPIHIPKKYIEQIKDRDFSVEKFYVYQKQACCHMVDNKPVLNPLNILYALADEENIVKGVCWMVVDPLCDALVINTFSVDKEYWKSKTCIKILQEKALEIKKGANLERIYWITRSAKHSENHGFKRSNQVLMEYRDGKDGNGKCSDRSSGTNTGSERSVVRERSIEREGHKPTDSATDEVLE